MEKLLNEIAEIKAGQGAPQGSENYSLKGTPFIKAGNLYDLIHGQSINSIQKVNDNVAKKYRLKKFPAGTVVFAKSGMSCLKGYVYVLPTEAFVVNHLACIVPYSDLSEYLKYYFVKHKPSELIKDDSYPSIRLSDISEIKINIPNLSVCNRVVTILNNIEALINKKKIQLLEYDQLIKSQFVEMFGTPGKNGKRWIYGTISDIGRCVAGATPSTKVKDYWENGTIAWMSSGEVNKGRIYHTDTKISELGYKNASTKLVPPHTVVLAMAGQGKTRGTVAITEIELCTNQSICSIVNNEKIDPEYLLMYLKMQYEELRNVSNGAEGRGGLNLKIIGNFPIMIPPIEHQIKFASIVKHVDKLKSTMQQSLNETQQLFDSLMQEYFG